MKYKTINTNTYTKDAFQMQIQILINIYKNAFTLILTSYISYITTQLISIMLFQ